MKIAPLMVMAALGVPLTLGCGGDTSDAPAAGADQVSPAPERAGEHAMKFGEYSGRALTMQASLSPEAQAKMEELQKRGEACSQKIAGGE